MERGQDDKWAVDRGGRQRREEVEEKGMEDNTNNTYKFSQWFGDKK